MDYDFFVCGRRHNSECEMRETFFLYGWLLFDITQPITMIQ